MCPRPTPSSQLSLDGARRSSSGSVDSAVPGRAPFFDLPLYAAWLGLRPVGAGLAPLCWSSWAAEDWGECFDFGVAGETLLLPGDETAWRV